MAHRGPRPTGITATAGTTNGSTNHAFADELRLIVEGEQPLDDMLSRVADLAKRLLPPPVEASVTLINGGTPATVAFTNHVAVALDETQYARGFGPCVDAAYAHEMITIRDMTLETHWPDYVATALGHGVLSSLSVPMPVHAPAVAALNIYAFELDAFDEHSVEVAKTIAEYAAIAIANTLRLMSRSQLACQMAEAMATRSAIEQAKGILMSRNRCGPDEAFRLLVRRSQQSHQKVHDVAAIVVREAISGTHDSGEGPDKA